MPPDTRDLTPMTVTAPAYIWGPVLDAIRRAAHHARKRALLRPPRHGGANLNELTAATLDEAEVTITAARAAPRLPPPGPLRL